MIMIDRDVYLLKAQEAVREIFVNEYHSSLGLPLPEIKFLLPDDEEYRTGKYYIQIGDTWQISLHFGELPIGFGEFKEEVRVLTRHEVGHYMFCPFDVLTHFRMLRSVKNIYEKEFAQLGLDIARVCGEVSNQVSDIIVDTVNYRYHPKETLKSERAWIMKGGDFSQSPKYGKLMFLTKEAIWGQDLGLGEQDKSLMDVVMDLAICFQEGGIETRSLFQKKTEAYARCFFRLCEDEYSCEQQCGQFVTGDSGARPRPIQNANPKNGNGGEIVLGSLDEIRAAIEAFAQETTLDEFSQILAIAEVKGFSKRDKERLWFSFRAANIIPIIDYASGVDEAVYGYPSLWKMGDSFDELDLTLSVLTSPKIIPGMTTKKWIKLSSDIPGTKRRHRDLFLVVDTSTSMGNLNDERSNLHQAILAAYGIIAYFESIQGKVAILGFSNWVTTWLDWSEDYEQARESLLVNGTGGTIFPIRQIESFLEQATAEVVTVLVTDGELGNMEESLRYFRQYLNEGNHLYVFVLGKSASLSRFEPLVHIGARVIQAHSAESLCHTVIDDFS